MNRILLRSIILLVVMRFIVYTQSVYVPIQHEVYDFLKRMEAHQLLTEYKDAARPLSRIQIASALLTLEKHVNEMTRVERETYEFLKTEFNYEMLKISGDPEPSETRWHIYSKDINDGILNFDINYSLSEMFVKNQSTSYRSQGIKTYGYIFNTVGFYFNFVDNLEKGDQINYSRLNNDAIMNWPSLSAADKEYYSRIKTAFRGVVPSKVEGINQYQYDELNAQLSWQIGSFTFSLEKMNNIWGYGKNGTVIFSDNTPSYPQIKMRVPISKNIDFIYFHGELNSNVIDSSKLYKITYVNPAYSKYRDIERAKYIAAHQIEISLWNGVDLSLGESVVYSDRGPLLIYLIPVMFFKAAEHYNGDKDNCQLFGSLDLNIIKNVNAYISLFIDELNTDELFDPNLSHRQVAFTTGIRVFDLPSTNIDMTLEYSRVNPATYNHNIPSATFTNNGFVLGNWMGQNADNLYLELGFTPMHALHLTAFSEIFRKGGNLSIRDQYAVDQGNWTFLFGPLHVERSIGVNLQYQPIRDIFVHFNGRVHTIEDEADPSQNRSQQFECTIGASLGLW